MDNRAGIYQSSNNYKSNDIGDSKMTNENKHTPAPWGNDLTPLIKSGDPTVKLNGRPSREALRVLAEDNFQYAKHRVNCHAELLDALERWVDFHEGNASVPEYVYAAIARARGEG